MEVFIAMGLVTFGLWLFNKHEEQTDKNNEIQAQIEKEAHEAIVRGQVNEAN